jgi:hypothetical protein
MTELAVIDAEVVQLTEKQAKALDKRVRAASDKLSTSTDNLLGLLEEAAAGEIHVALGLSSWTAWFKDAVQIQVSDRFQRKELVNLMSGKGMSQRAIAGTLGVSQKTVDRDLEGQEFESDTVTSLDGAERARNGKPVEPEEEPPLDVESEPIMEPVKAVDIVTAFSDEVANLFAAENELSQLMLEDKWGSARKRVAKASLNDVQGVIHNLQIIVDDLMTGAS